MNSDFFHKIRADLAVERLSVYQQDDANELITLARYLWNMALCEALYSPLQIAEIALRNAIHSALVDKYKSECWFDIAPLTPWGHEQVGKAKSKLAQINKPQTNGRIVAELHFGFWTSFFNKAYEKDGLTHYLLSQVLTVNKSMRTVSAQHKRWEDIRTLRNRVFHHERIIHWKDLQVQHANIIQAIGWISRELEEMAIKLDRFFEIYSRGIDPWMGKIKTHWPNRKL